MEDIANLASRVIVLTEGEIIFDGVPRKLFVQDEILKRAGLVPPAATKLLQKISRAGLTVNAEVLTIDEAENEIWRTLK